MVFVFAYFYKVLNLITVGFKIMTCRKNFVSSFIVWFAVINMTHSQEVIPENIKTIQVQSSDGGQNNMVPLGSRLHFSFDDLEADQKDYYYRVQHMTHDWKPSRLISSQYINGFQENVILDIENSFNTFQVYSHYRFTIPNRNTVLTKSGNYLISVLNDNQEVVFSRKVTYFEKITTVGVSVSRSRQANASNQEQTVQFTVNHPTIRLNMPDKEIHVVVLQNQNWKTSLTGVRPQFFKPNQLVFRYTNKTNFLGGNEYLNFDTKIIQNQGVNIQRIERKEVFHNYLFPYQSREVKNYTFSPDINGQFLIQTAISENNNTESDYAMMHFSMIPTENEKSLDLFIYGGFNNFNFNESNRMTFNPNTRKFEATILMKQGFYNYTFATRDGNKVNQGAVLGNFSKTENRYDVLVYYKPMGGLFDRVVGLGTIRFEGEF